VGETYLPAFLLALGASEVLAGLVATVPLLAGAVLQLASPRAVRRLGSLKRWVVTCAAIQTLSFVPLLGAALLGRVPVVFTFVVATVYWGAGMATGPAWNTWIGTVVPSRLRARFFARRTRLSQLTVLTGLLTGGALLQAGEELGMPLEAFALAFLLAACCRSISVIFLAYQSEPRPLPADFRSVSLRGLAARLRDGKDARLLFYMLVVALCAQSAAPFFTPYMLGELRLSYLEYMTLLGTAFVAKIVTLPALGTFARRFGAQRLLWLGGVGIVPLSALWLASDSFAYLFGLQLVAGCAWGAYELATFLLIFETIPEEERTSVLTLYNLANASMIVSGSLLGGALLNGLGQDHGAYAAVFAASAAGRALTLLLLTRVAPVRFGIVPLAIRTLALRPSAGSTDVPVLPSIPPTPSEDENDDRRAPGDAASGGSPFA